MTARVIPDGLTPRDRTLVVHARLRRRGFRVGGVPYGMKLAEDQRTLIEEPHEQDVILRVRLLRARGYSVNEIARLLDDGRVPCRGTQWHATTVWRILRRAGKQ